MNKKNILRTMAFVSIATLAMSTGCKKDIFEESNTVGNSADASARISSPTTNLLGSASTFAVLAGTTITSVGNTSITGDIGVSPGTAITGFQPSPYNTISGPGTVTAGLGLVIGTIYAGGPVAAQAHADASVAYNFLVSQVPDKIYAGVTQLDGDTFTPGTYYFAPSANLMVNGTMYLDFQGNSDALFIFQVGTTLVTMTGSNIIALNTNNQTCSGSNVYWAVGSSATIDGQQFIGTVIANTSISMTSGGMVSGRMLALNGAVTLIENTINICNGSGTGIYAPKICRDFVTGGGWIENNAGIATKNNVSATFGVSGGIKNGKFWGQLSFNNHQINGLKFKSSSVTSYTVLGLKTRQIEGYGTVNGKEMVSYTVVLTDNGEPGVMDEFSLLLSNGYMVKGTLLGGNIKLHKVCSQLPDSSVKEKYDDKDESEGNNKSGL